MTSAPQPELTLELLIDRARALVSHGERAMLGITGAPGAGKSTLAEELVRALGDDLAVLVPMDGFHYAQAVLNDLGRTARKGAPDTFDAWGYAALLHRIRGQRTMAARETALEEGTPEEIIYAPAFSRELEEPIGSAIPVRSRTPLVVTEGNYLLLEGDAWARARAALDETWYLDPPEEQRLQWLIERHERFGRSPEEARERSLGSDQRNAELIAQTADRADLVIR